MSFIFKINGKSHSDPLREAQLCTWANEFFIGSIIALQCCAAVVQQSESAVYTHI